MELFEKMLVVKLGTVKTESFENRVIRKQSHSKTESFILSLKELEQRT